MSETKPAPVSTQFRVHYLVCAPSGEWTQNSHDVWAQTPELARTFTLTHLRKVYGEDAKPQIGKIKQLRVDKTGRGWYRGKKGK